MEAGSVMFVTMQPRRRGEGPWSGQGKCWTIHAARPLVRALEFCGTFFGKRRRHGRLLELFPAPALDVARERLRLPARRGRRRRRRGGGLLGRGGGRVGLGLGLGLGEGARLGLGPAPRRQAGPSVPITLGAGGVERLARVLGGRGRLFPIPGFELLQVLARFPRGARRGDGVRVHRVALLGHRALPGLFLFRREALGELAFPFLAASLAKRRARARSRFR